MTLTLNLILTLLPNVDTFPCGLIGCPAERASGTTGPHEASMLAVWLLLAVVNGPRCKLARSYPAVLAADADSNGGEDRAITFTRIIVMPDGQRWVEGVTPKQLPAPASHTLPNSEEASSGINKNMDLEE